MLDSFLIGSVAKSPSMSGYNLTTKVEGKTVTLYVRKDIVPKAVEMNGRYKKLWFAHTEAFQGQLGDPEPGEQIGMQRRPYPPHDFTCLYEHTCPYLDGLSTSWVLGQYRRADDVYHEHLQIIDSYSAALKAGEDRVGVSWNEGELAELRAKYQALHRKQFKPNRKRDEADGGREECDASSTGMKKKKRGAPVGHPGWTRPVPTRIDRIVPVPAPSVCPHCGSHDLTPEDTIHEHIQEDIVVKPQTVVTKYLHEEAFCRRCNRTVVGWARMRSPTLPSGRLQSPRPVIFATGSASPTGRCN